MTLRAQQKADTRQRIVEAAIEVFSEYGFRGGSTRDIAARAGENQGLITYHFQSKEELWKAAADHIFSRIRAALAERFKATLTDKPLQRAREGIRAYVRFAAAHPELFHMLVDDGKHPDERMTWLVETHVRPLYQVFRAGRLSLPDPADEAEMPFAFYTFIGASSLIFAVAPECKELTGVDPLRKKAIEAHANYLATLLIPDRPARPATQKAK